MGKKITTEEFIKKAKEIHGDKYDYSKVEYTRAKEKVIIICPIHGEFKQTPNDHLQTKGCKYCSYERTSKRFKKSKGDFLKKAKLNDLFFYNFLCFK